MELRIILNANTIIKFCKENHYYNMLPINTDKVFIKFVQEHREVGLLEYRMLIDLIQSRTGGCVLDTDIATDLLKELRFYFTY